MKKIILSTFAFIITLSASAQIEIYHGSNEIDISGTLIDVVIDESIVNPSGESIWEEHFIVKNLTGADGEWRIKRTKIDVPSGWNDQVCWPPNCYLTNNYETYSTPSSQAPTIINGTTDAIPPLAGTTLAEIKPGVMPDFGSPSSATYKYYIMDKNTGLNLDSITVRYSYGILSIPSTSKMNLSIAPNPANEFVGITLEGTETAQIKIVDVLGNTVYSKQISGTTKIGTAEFNSGVYFISIQGENKKAITKKLVVRH